MAVNDNEQQYLDLARYVLEHGHETVSYTHLTLPTKA